MENRESLRKRTYIGAKIVLNGNRSVIDCVVKDLSETGARIAVESAISVPDTFEMSLSDGRVFHCNVRWRRINAIGVHFAA